MNPLFSALSRHLRLRERGRCKARPRSRPGFRPRLEVLEDRALPSAYVVTTTADTGAGSLRDAVNQVNTDTSHTLYVSPSNPSVDEIDFAISAGSDTGGGYNATTKVATITPQSGLPTITNAVFIDGSIQPGYSGTPLIELNGVHAGGGVFGLDITAGNCTVRGLAIDQFTNTAIKLSGGGGNRIAGNYIGTDANGDAGLGNGSGVNIAGSSGNTIGGTAPGDGNVISGNVGGDGIDINGTGATGNLVQGNLIGTNVNGTSPLANYGGVTISSGAANNTIGGTTAAARNIVSGNNTIGIWITNAGTTNNVIEGDYVGTDVTGEAAVANREGGILINAGAQGNLIGTDGNGSPEQIQAERNLISGNNQPFVAGIAINQSSNNVVAGNYIGTDATGTQSLPNGFGIGIGGDNNFIGTTAAGVAEAATRNVISGNGYDGMYLQGNHNVVAGNFIGTDPTGMHANLNGGGIWVDYGQYNQIGTNGDGVNDAAEGNVIDSAHVDITVDDSAAFNVIAGNLIGTDVTGTVVLAANSMGIQLVHGAHDNRIGVNASDLGHAAERNVISGHNIGIDSEGGHANMIAGNLIGSDITGLLPLGNNYGIQINDSDDEILDNLISAASNGELGIIGTGNVVAGNLIGTDITGTASLGGGVAWGVDIGASNNTIGGTVAGARNIISGNAGAGVDIYGVATTGNVVEGNFIGTDVTGTKALGNGEGVVVSDSASGNTIGGTTAGAGNTIAYNNSGGVLVSSVYSSGISILGNSIHDNGGLGISLVNGANNNQAAPVLTSASTSTTSTTVAGTLASVANTTFRVEFFSNQSPDPSGYGEGQTYLGFATVTTDGSGHATFSASLSTPPPLGQHYLSATATDPNGNTSQFSRDIKTDHWTLASSVNPSVWNQPVTFTASLVAPSSGAPAPTGSVTFTDTTTGQTLGTVAIAGGSATLTRVTLSVGAHNITALYSGDGNYVSSSAALTQTVNQDPTTATITTSAASSIPGQPVTFTVAVMSTAPGSGVPTGSVDIRDTVSGLDLGIVTLVSGSATLTTSAVPLGSYHFQATYSGDTNFLSSNASLTQSITQSIYVLNKTESGAVTVSGHASINIPGSLFVDSKSKTALSESGYGQITAASIQVVGGVKKSGHATLSPAATTGVAVVADPLAGLVAPTGGAAQGSVNLSKGKLTINPGVYKSIKVSGNASLTLNPGVYTITGGGFTVSGNGSISGSGVVLYDAGGDYGKSDDDRGGFTLSGNGTFNVTAPTSGPYAGIVIFQARDNTRAMSLSRNAALGLGGTIYAPKALLYLTGDATIQGPLVVNELSLSGDAASTQSTDGSDLSAGTLAGQLLGGDLLVYVNDPNGLFSTDELARIQDAVNAAEAVVAPYGITVAETTDSSLATVIVDMSSTSAAGGYTDGVLGCYNPSGEITMIQGWNWYAGTDATQIGASQYDFQTTLTHELGHALGLGESSAATSAMSATLATGTVVRALTKADLQIPDVATAADPQRAAGFGGETLAEHTTPLPGFASENLASRDLVFAALATEAGTGAGLAAMSHGSAAPWTQSAPRQGGELVVKSEVPGQLLKNDAAAKANPAFILDADRVPAGGGQHAEFSVGQVRKAWPELPAVPMSTTEDALRTIAQAQRNGPGATHDIVEQPVAREVAQPVGSVTAAIPLVGLVLLVHANPGIATESRKSGCKFENQKPKLKMEIGN